MKADAGKISQWEGCLFQEYDITHTLAPTEKWVMTKLVLQTYNTCL